MIQKVVKGRGFRGVLVYLTSQDRGKLIASNMAGENPRELAREFATVRRMRPALGKAVAHISISLSPEDRNLTDEEFSAVATTYLEHMGFNDCPFVAIRHNDTQHQHIHIVASRIKTNGEVVSDSQDYKRGEQILRILEKNLELIQIQPSVMAKHKSPTRKELQLINQGEKTMKQEIRSLIDEAIESSSNITEFLAKVSRLGITVCPHIQGSRISGLIYEWKARKAKFKGSDLGKKYTWAGIQEHVQYRPDLDFIALNKLKRAEEASHPAISLPETVSSAERREFRRMILDEEYIRFLRSIFGSDLLTTQKKNDTLEIELKQGRILDTGETISADKMDNATSAVMLARLAKEKGWDTVVVSGSNEFVRLAMREALKLDLPIEPKDEAQAQILAEIMAEFRNPQPTTSPNRPGFALPTLNPMNLAELNRKHKEEEEQKRKKRLGYR